MSPSVEGGGGRGQQTSYDEDEILSATNVKNFQFPWENIHRLYGPVSMANRDAGRADSNEGVPSQEETGMPPVPMNCPLTWATVGRPELCSRHRDDTALGHCTGSYHETNN